MLYQPQFSGSTVTKTSKNQIPVNYHPALFEKSVFYLCFFSSKEADKWKVAVSDVKGEGRGEITTHSVECYREKAMKKNSIDFRYR